MEWQRQLAKGGKGKEKKQRGGRQRGEGQMGGEGQEGEGRAKGRRAKGKGRSRGKGYGGEEAPAGDSMLQLLAGLDLGCRVPGERQQPPQ